MTLSPPIEGPSIYPLLTTSLLYHPQVQHRDKEFGVIVALIQQTVAKLEGALAKKEAQEKWIPPDILRVSSHRAATCTV